MGGINIGRWLGGGVVAAIVIFVLEGVGALLYMEDMQAALDQFGITMEMTPTGWILPVLLSLIVGLFLVFLYAAARPRFGPGPKTAVLVAAAAWLGAGVTNLLGYAMIGLYPTGLLALWAAQLLVEWIIAALVGGWIYREAAA